MAEHPGWDHQKGRNHACILQQHKHKEYFSGCQWLVGDSACKLTTTVITPYRSNATQATLDERNTFNKQISRFRGLQMGYSST